MGQQHSGARTPTALEQEVYDKDVSASRFTEIPSNQQGRWAYDTDNNCIYAGYAPRGLSESSDGWLLQKFTWVGGNCTKREIAYDSWSNYLTATYA